MVRSWKKERPGIFMCHWEKMGVLETLCVELEPKKKGLNF